MIITKLYLDTRTQKKDGTFPVKIYISNNRKVSFISTGFSSKIENWKNDHFVDFEPNYRAKNVRLREIINKVEKTIFDIEEKGELLSINNYRLIEIIKKKLSGKNDNMNFVDCLNEFIGTKTKQGTISVYRHTLFKIIEFDQFATFNSITKAGEMINMFRKGAEWADACHNNPWTSVKDRLPETEQEVLLYDKDSICHYIVGCLREKKGYNKSKWRVTNGYVFDESITHWMPIVEPK